MKKSFSNLSYASERVCELLYLDRGIPLSGAHRFMHAIVVCTHWKRVILLCGLHHAAMFGHLQFSPLLSRAFISPVDLKRDS